MIKRIVTNELIRLARQYPVVTVTGPRQSGKTTLCKSTFPQKKYVSLENLDLRRAANKDPKQFLQDYPDGAILDEIQRAPDLLSYIQGIVDENNKEGMFILTGSHQFELMDSVNQSLAGRTAVVRLLPFSYGEVYGEKKTKNDINQILFTGFYPRIFDKKLNPTEALSFYMTTYIERDVRRLVNVKDLSSFQKFITICATRVGQIINYESISNEIGVSNNTIKNWLSILEASFITFRLQPYFNNLGKRLIKSPKLYFTEVGLATYLLGIESEKEIPQQELEKAVSRVGGYKLIKIEK